MPDEHGEVSLHHAIAAGNTDIATTLISLMPPYLLNARNVAGETPLHLAIQHKAVS